MNDQSGKIEAPLFFRSVISSISLAALLVSASYGQSASGPCAGADGLFARGDTVVFLGDSNSYNGEYIVLLDAWWRRHRPGLDLQILNLALPSETASGLSEPEHPFPRPNVHDRLQRVLQQTRPDVVFVCYGINDGIYYPYSPERFAAFRQGICDLSRRIRQSGARLVLMTPFPFDPLPLQDSGRLRAVDSQAFAWNAPYQDYDQVMQRYARWIMSCTRQADLLIDLHTPLTRFLDGHRQVNPGFTVSPDGVHFDRQGHAVFARSILSALEGPSTVDFEEDYLEVIRRHQHLLRDAWLTHCGHDRPGMPAGMPLDRALRQARAMEARIDQLAAPSARRPASHGD